MEAQRAASRAAAEVRGLEAKRIEAERRLTSARGALDSLSAPSGATDAARAPKP